MDRFELLLVAMTVVVAVALSALFGVAIGYKQGQHDATQFLPPCIGSEIKFPNAMFTPLYELSFPNGTSVTVTQPNFLEPYTNVFVECQK